MKKDIYIVRQRNENKYNNTRERLSKRKGKKRKKGRKKIQWSIVEINRSYTCYTIKWNKWNKGRKEAKLFRK